MSTNNDADALVLDLAQILKSAPWVHAKSLILSGLTKFTSRSIDILPGSAEQWIESLGRHAPEAPELTSPFLFVEYNLGVPKKLLYQTYLAAIAMFTDALESTAVAHRLIASSAVILLANPAHQTALNTRKRLIQNGCLSTSDEFAFVAALLSTKSCAKEAILWDHRRWLFRRHYRFVHNVITDPDHYIPPEIMQQEFEIISHACQIYPRNYYAWSHWRFCANLLCSSIIACRTPPDTGREYAKVLSLELLRMRQWVETHVSDHSATHHLSGLLLHLVSHPNDSSILSDLLNEQAASTFDHALSLVKIYPSHESLWMYLRAAVYLDQSFANKKADLVVSLLAHENPVRSYRTLTWWTLKV
jgi:protein prenyltransferase alpha subunit repeat containing protein 1